MSRADIKRLERQLRALKAKQKNNDSLKWWTNKGFKVTEKGHTYTAKNGKEYDAVKGVWNGKEVVLKAVRGGSRHTLADF